MRNHSSFLRCLAAAIATTALFAAPNAFAGYVIDANVVTVRTSQYNTAFIFVSLPITNRPPCSAANTATQAFVIDVSTPGGKAMLQTALGAKLTNAKVIIRGQGETNVNTGCALFPATGGNGVESVDWIDLK